MTAILRLQPPKKEKRRSEAYRVANRSPADLNFEYEIEHRKTIINVGSIGQPRDLDPRACYVLCDGTTVRFIKVEYDYETTAEKIYRIPDLDNFLGDRLRDGR